MAEARAAGFEIGIHASYETFLEKRDLAGQVASFVSYFDLESVGHRAHWIRFDTQGNFLRDLRSSTIVYDSTLGFTTDNGFRNGASFAFPPYDFASEAACSFLEFPMVIMDSALESRFQSDHELAQLSADHILNESRRWGAGGVSIVWHDPVEPVNVSRKFNDIFWALAKSPTRSDKEAGDRWITAEQYIREHRHRFENAGLPLVS